MDTVQVTDDLFAEQKMKQFGASWKISDVMMDEIDFEKSGRNLARSIAINADHVIDLGIAMESGARLPRIVCQSYSKGKMVIASGNHRALAGKTLGIVSMSAYVIAPTDDALILEILPKVLNPPVLLITRQERLDDAVMAVDRGMLPAASAKVFSFSVNMLNDELKSREYTERLIKNGAPGDRLGKTQLLQLRSIKDMSIAVPLVRAAVRGKFTSRECEDFRREIQSKDTGIEAMQVVAKAEKMAGMEASPGGVIPPVRRGSIVRLRIALSTVENTIDKHRTLTGIGFTKKVERDEEIIRIDRVIGKLKAICKRG
jgi:hypothetical protein